MLETESFVKLGGKNVILGRLANAQREPRTGPQAEAEMKGVRSALHVWRLKVKVLCVLSEMNGAAGKKRRKEHLGIDHFYAPTLFAYSRPLNNMNDVPCNAA